MGFYHQIYGFPVNFPIFQFYDSYHDFNRDLMSIELEFGINMSYILIPFNGDGC